MQVNKIDNFTFRKKYELIPPSIISKKLKQSCTYAQIAAEYNVTRDVVARSVRNRIESSTEEKDKIYKLHQRKYSEEAIKTLLGYPIYYIKKVIKQFEAEQAPNSDSNKLVEDIVKKFNLDSSVMKNLK